VIKPAYSVSFLLSINIFVWHNVLYFPNIFHTLLVQTSTKLSTQEYVKTFCECKMLFSVSPKWNGST